MDCKTVRRPGVSPDGTLRIRHPQAGKDYDGPITLRKDYFMYRDGVKKNLSDYAE